MPSTGDVVVVDSTPGLRDFSEFLGGGMRGVSADSEDTVTGGGKTHVWVMRVSGT